jgi:hypothetical protein
MIACLATSSVTYSVRWCRAGVWQNVRIMERSSLTRNPAFFDNVDYKGSAADTPDGCTLPGCRSLGRGRKESPYENCALSAAERAIPGSRQGFLLPTDALLLLLTFRVSLLAVLARILRMLLGVSRMFLALRVVIFSVVFGRGAMGLGGILVMFGCFIVSVLRHVIPPLRLVI